MSSNIENQNFHGVVILMRHGEAALDSKGNKTLTPSGIYEAKQVNNFIKESLGIDHIDCVVTSGVQRAEETANIVTKDLIISERYIDKNLCPGNSGIALEVMNSPLKEKIVLIVTHIPTIESEYSTFLDSNAYFDFSPAACVVLVLENNKYKVWASINPRPL